MLVKHQHRSGREGADGCFSQVRVVSRVQHPQGHPWASPDAAATRKEKTAQGESRMRPAWASGSVRTVLKSPQLEQLQRFLLGNWQNERLHNPEVCVRKWDPTTQELLSTPLHSKKCSTQEILSVYLLLQIPQMIITAAQHVIPQNTRGKKSDYGPTHKLTTLSTKNRNKKRNKQRLAWKHTRQNPMAIQARYKFSLKLKYFPLLLNTVLQKYGNKLAEAGREQREPEQTRYTAEHSKTPPLPRSRRENMPLYRLFIHNKRH